ncbi:hypothetical protein VFPPC_15424 [Pochonia chlamydosporia 170]|uniref:Uncharacterized protein n=1 Tax=Pochonia chlamydosporia 170 TaxID=1380566 RepID=A0A179G9J1_METCM|nr:hypothetical protein VFPPC_15424 [Pochonia chlamydosporia 170]OAQ74188.1 hypothetical protein VFPPC_15424 [Pochonia chlamydosporia 170]
MTNKLQIQVDSHAQEYTGCLKEWVVSSSHSAGSPTTITDSCLASSGTTRSVYVKGILQSDATLICQYEPCAPIPSSRVWRCRRELLDLLVTINSSIECVGGYINSSSLRPLSVPTASGLQITHSFPHGINQIIYCLLPLNSEPVKYPSTIAVRFTSWTSPKAAQY